MSSRRRALVLAYHEPTLDPRVHYTAESLAARYDVTVVATVQASETRPEHNRPRASYETIRIPYAKRGATSMTYAFFDLIMRERLGESRIARLAGQSLALGLFAGATLVSAAALGLAMALNLIVPAMPARAQRRLDEIAQGIRVTASVLRFTFSANALLWKYIRNHRLKPDLVYCHDLYTLQAGLMSKRATPCRLIYDSHEYYPHQHDFWCYRPVVRFYESVLVRSVDVYLTVTPQLANELRMVYRVPAVHWIPNVEPAPPARLTRSAGEMTRLADGRLKILYQGSFAEARGLEEVLGEWLDVDGSAAALFLRGPRNVWLDHLERLASDLRLLGRSVYVLSPVLEKDLIAAAHEADVGLIPYKTDWPSYRFACPNKLSQYLHAGLAILSNRLPYVEHVVTEGRLGLCYDDASKASLSAAIRALSQDRLAVEQFKKNAVAYAERVYNWSRFEPLLLKLVDEASV